MTHTHTQLIMNPLDAMHAFNMCAGHETQNGSDERTMRGCPTVLAVAVTSLGNR